VPCSLSREKRFTSWRGRFSLWPVASCLWRRRFFFGRICSLSCGHCVGLGLFSSFWTAPLSCNVSPCPRFVSQFPYAMSMMFALSPSKVAFPHWDRRLFASCREWTFSRKLINHPDEICCENERPFHVIEVAGQISSPSSPAPSELAIRRLFRRLLLIVRRLFSAHAFFSRLFPASVRPVFEYSHTPLPSLLSRGPSLALLIFYFRSDPTVGGISF